jgi:hypothetical protein
MCLDVGNPFPRPLFSFVELLNVYYVLLLKLFSKNFVKFIAYVRPFEFPFEE